MGLGLRLRLARLFVSGYSGVCFEIKFSGRHRGFNGGYKAEQVECRGTGPLPFHYLGYTSLSLSRVGSDQAAGKQAGRVHYEKRERSHSIYTSHTHCQASLMVLHYTTLVPPLRLCVHWASPRGRPQHWYVKGARATL